jgi:hypothetical protein
MKHFLLGLLLFVISPVDIRAQASGGPVEHMNYFTKLEEELSKKYLSYMSEVAHGRSARKLEKRRSEVVAAITQAIYESGKVRPYNGDASLRDAYKTYCAVLLSVFKEDYHKIVDMEEVAEQSYDDMELYLLTQEKAKEKLREAYNKVGMAYESFALKHHVRLGEGQSSKLSQRLDEAGKVNSYMNQVYLLFFKSNVQEGLMFQAMTKNDVNGVEQSKNSLLKFSTEGLQRLDTLKPFKGDRSLITACQKVLEFQKDEAENKASHLTDFQLKKEEFEKMKKSFDTKPAKSRTQADVDAYNKAINEYNNAVNDYNKTSEELNRSREKVINSWEATRKRFLDLHVPYKL